MRIKLLGIALAVLMTNILVAQEEGPEAELESEIFRPHAISLLIGHTFLTRGIRNGEKVNVNVPSWALTYNYNFNENWALGFHADMIIEEFQVEFERGEEGVLAREYPVSLLVAGTYKPTGKLGIVLGGGAELEKNESFGLIRIGLDYGFPLAGDKWEFLVALNYDILIDAYNSSNINFGIARRF